MNRSSRFFALRAALAALAVPLVVSFPLLTGCPQIGMPSDPNTVDPNAEPNTPTETPKGNAGLTGKFAGSERCSLCHNNIHTDWANTLHAKAYETLEGIGQESNPNCIGCHTVGFGEPGGWVDRATTNALAGVGCEACHGGAADHANNASDASLRPTVNISASVCGRCHTDEHHPNYEDWLMSKHESSIEPSHVTNWSAGGQSSNLQTCGVCHSGDYFYHKVIKNETLDSKGRPVDGNYLQGKTLDEMNPITCAVCHNPHARTGNAAAPDEGRDYQLRYAQVKYTSPTNTIAAATDPSRFNLCGQCHHSRDKVWTDTSREPHPSDQVNVFFGEMPLPDGKPDPIITPRPSVHLNAAEQCSTCHVYRAPLVEGLAPAVSGHTFEVNFGGCAECHGTAAIAEAKLGGLKAEIQSRLTTLKNALDAWGASKNIDGKGALSWEYVSEGGPKTSEQAKIPDDIKKARFIYYYVAAGGGNGAHNPDYVREGLMGALTYVQNAP